MPSHFNRKPMMTKQFSSGLKISNLSVTYKNGVKALDSITLNIPYGMYGLLGPNGAGKSTLMRILATLQEPDEGSIFLDHLDLLKDKEQVRATLGYLPQDFGLPKYISAEKLLYHFSILKGIPSNRTEIVQNLLIQTNLWEKRKESVSSFSGGMRQRFGVAVALLGDPKLLIVDEPTAGLDPDERVRFLNLLSELGEKSVVILSSHIVEDIAELCTAMAIIKKGKILLETSPFQCISDLRGSIWEKTVDRQEIELIEDQLTVISKKRISGKTLIRVSSKHYPGLGFSESRPTLEDVYFLTIAGFNTEKKNPASI